MAASGGMWAKPSAGLFKNYYVFVTKYDLQKMASSGGGSVESIRQMIKAGAASGGVVQKMDQLVSVRVRKNNWYLGRRTRSLVKGAFGAEAEGTDRTFRKLSSRDPLTGLAYQRRGGEVVVSKQNLARLGARAYERDNGVAPGKEVARKELVRLGQAEWQRVGEQRKREFGLDFSKKQAGPKDMLRDERAQAKADPRLNWGSQVFGAQAAGAAQKRGAKYVKDGYQDQPAPGAKESQPGFFLKPPPTKSAEGVRTRAQNKIARVQDEKSISGNLYANTAGNNKVAPKLSKQTTSESYTAEGVGVRMGKRVDSISAGIFGRAVTAREIAGLMGAPKGSKITVSARMTNGSPELVLKGRHADLTKWNRVLRFGSDGKLEMFNVELSKKAGAPKLTGLKLLANQVDTARRMGITRIVTQATGSGSSTKYNGHYTWARYGFDGAIPASVKSGAAWKGTPYAKAKNVQQLMRMDGGAQFWRAHGGTTDMTFDTRRGSKQSKYLDELIKISGLSLHD